MSENPRETLPYGKWTCADGREVLFNRYYKPIWERYPGQPVKSIGDRPWIEHIKSEYYYDDDDHIATNKELQLELLQKLTDFFFGNDTK